MPKEYQSATTVYTGLASGTNISTIGEARVDYFAVNNAFDNLIATVKSRETIEETAMRLMAQHLQQKQASIAIINEASIKKLQLIIPDTLRKKLLVIGNEDSTYQNIYNYKNQTNDNVIADIINSTGTHYSVPGILARLTVMRKASSDFLDMTFKANDQGVCLNTLKLLVEIFQRRYKGVKGSESFNVVKYFEEQLKIAQKDLRTAEDALKNFGVDNRIINYPMQSQFLAESKEDMTTDYYKEVMVFGGAKAAVEKLEQRMEERGSVVNNNKDIAIKRNELSELYKKLYNAKSYNAPPEEIADIQYEIDEANEALKQLAKEFMKRNFSVESVPQNNLITEWLQRVLEYEESSARLTVFEKRLEDYNGIYDEFAPLGSEINRLNRGVDVAEKEYLSVLHGLNLAKLKEQNLKVANSLTIMDEPYLPLIPLASKRMILVIASFIGGFVLLLAFFVGQEMLDFALRSPEKAVKSSGLPLAGALPVYRPRTNIKKAELEHLLMEQLVTSITIAEREVEKITTYYQINIFSSRQGEGKTYLCQLLANRYATIGGKVLYLYPENSQLGKVAVAPNVVMVPYKVPGSFVETPGIQALLAGSGYSSFEFSHVFLELPFLSHNTVPYDLAAQAHLSLLVINAEKNWGSAPERLIGLYQKSIKNKLMLVLNRVEPEMLEGIYGEIPKRRSQLRRIIKNVVSKGAI